jgi:hypothetical protein
METFLLDESYETVPGLNVSLSLSQREGGNHVQ